MKQITYSVIIIFLGLTLWSCKSTKTTNKEAHNTSSSIVSATKSKNQLIDINNDSPLISIEKGACHGTCPIYKMTIYNNGHCEFKGKRFCKKLGAFAATISALELDLLQQKIAMLDMENYQEQYQSMIPDFPSTEITSYTKDASKSVWWRDGAPSELDEMAVVLDKFRQDLNWEVDINAPLPAGTIENQMLISLKDEVKAKDFAIEYSAYTLIPVKELVPNQNYWLFEFDIKKISGVEMLNLLHKSEQIHNAEFNKELEQRH